MISSLRGEVSFSGKNFLELAVGGVGYKIYAGANLLASAKVGQQLTVYTYLHVRQDVLDLFGAASREELEFFYSLISVSGVGPKSALHILELGALNDIKQAIIVGDVNFLTKVSGVGRKIAERIVVELKDKLAFGSAKSAGGAFAGTPMGDIVDALVNMGYGMAQVREAIREIDASGKSTAEIIKAALKILQKR